MATACGRVYLLGTLRIVVVIVEARGGAPGHDASPANPASVHCLSPNTMASSASDGDSFYGPEAGEIPEPERQLRLLLMKLIIFQ